MKQMLRLLAVWCTLVASMSLLTAQQAGVEMLTTRDGLSQGYISCLHQDQEGYLWIGTKNGLNRYDGYHFKEFTPDPYDEYSLGHDYIQSISERGDFLIIGANKGRLNLMHKKTHRVFHLPFNWLLASSENIDGAIVWSDFDAFGGLWVQAFLPDRGSYLTQITFPEGFWQKQPENDNWLADLKVKALPDRIFGEPCLGRDKKFLLIPYETSIHQLDILSGRSVPLISSLRTRYGAWLHVDSRGNILVNCRVDNDPALFLLVPGNPSRLEQLPTPPEFKDLYHTADSLIWLETQQGCRAYRPDKNGRFNLAQPETRFIPTPSGQSSLLRDRSGIIWLGTNGVGLIKFNPRSSSFRHLFPGESVSSSILQDQNGNLCTAASNYRLLFALKHQEGVIPAFQKIGLNLWLNGKGWIDRKGILWMVGMRSEDHPVVLTKLSEDGKLRYFPLPLPALPAHEFTAAIATGVKGKVWMACGGKLLCFDPASEHIQSHEYVPLVTKAHTVNALLPTSGGCWWIATNEGLIRALPEGNGFDFQIFKTNPADQNSLRNNNVASLLADPADPEVIWIGTKGGGLNRLDLRKLNFTHLTTANGLPNNVIYAILPDSSGNLWMSSNKGLIRYTPSDGDIRNYTEADGVQASEFNTWAYGKGLGGELFFGGVNGITAFHPRDLSSNMIVPPVWINGLRLNDKEVGLGHPGDLLQQTVEVTRSITVPYSQNNITLEFVALDYAVPGRNRFRYYLEGAEETWRHKGNGHQATYLNLAPGTYTFRVKGSNSDGIWNETPAELTITVLPPWYLAWWAYLIYALVAGGVVYQFYRYQLRRRLEHAETLRLKELDAFKSNFFTNVSHDLRTPLTLILSPLKRLLKNGNFTSEETRQLQLMARSGEQLRERIEEILALSRLEAGKLELQETVMELHAVLVRLMGNFESHARQSGIELVFYYEAPHPCYVLLDRNKLEKILNNLLGNAMKFTPAGGKVMLTARTHDGSEGADKFLTISVIDTGKGIPEEDQPYVFNRYFQTSGKKVMPEGGTGIGLAIVRELTDLMGGRVSLFSAPGQGATFTIQLPLRPVESDGSLQPEEDQETFNLREALAPTIVPMGTSRKTRLLVVEDNYALREYLEMVLSPYYEVVTAANGRIAWDYCQQPEFNCALILSDIMMPEMDGFGLLEKVKSYAPTRLLPFIFLSARAGLEDRLTAMRIGVDDYLLKPFEEEELLARVANSLRNYRERTAVGAAAVAAGVETALPEAGLAVPDVAESWLEKLRLYTLDNLTNPVFSIQHLTEEAGMGHSAFNEKMKLETGLTPNLFVREIRLLRARTLLETAACNSVQEVCRTVGFQKTAYFSQLFKERFGKNPSEYLKN